MGVPAFFRWLSRKYSSIVVHAKEDKQKIIDGIQVPIDITQPNPNNVEFDNLYLDMNGIIHPCCHPENKPAPKNEDEMMVLIFEYIDRLMAIVRPRKLLYMAIDGVAPRAKMNQQRSRRFRASKDSRENREEIAKVKEEMREKGLEVPADKPASEHFDSNCITPGTPFMSRLADCLRYYVHLRINNDPGWSQLMVILSDANAPGEGEHKIMDFIRRQRAQPDHDPNTHHCLCGADADLIMLGLATHEPNFTIIREEFKPNAERACEICGGSGHQMKECMGLTKVKSGEFDEIPKFVGTDVEFIFIRLNILREYLYRELTMVNLPFKEDVERAIDDWVLMCFFVGNDFLPHLPSLEIREGAIDRLIGIYKKVVYKTGGYLTNSGIVNLERVQLMLTDLGEVEDAIFKKRRETDLEFKRRNQEKAKRQRRSDSYAPKSILEGELAPLQLGLNLTPQPSTSQSIREYRQQSYQQSLNYSCPNLSANQSAAYNLKQRLDSSFSRPDGAIGQVKRKYDEVADGEEEEEGPKDDVRLWEDGWKERYYINKFGVDVDDIDFRIKVANEYVLGMCWVLKYYYQGCASWDWYFPYHYAPFASDFQNIGSLDTTFPDNTKPFNPLEQLMSVFPAASKQFLPPTWQVLMYQPISPIIDFYPEDFKIDLNGKKFAWQGVALLPFVDEKRLLRVLETVYPDLTDDEKYRNTRGNDRLFVHKLHMSFDCLNYIYKHSLNEEKQNLNPSMTNGVAGLIWGDDKVCLTGEVVPSPLPEMEDLTCNQVISVKYQDPQFEKGFTFPSILLPKAKIPPPVLKPEDFNRNFQGQRFQAQTGFARDSGYSQHNNSQVLNRHIRANLDHSSPNQAFNYNYNDARGSYNNNNYRGGGYNNNNNNYRGGGYNNNNNNYRGSGYNNNNNYRGGGYNNNNNYRGGGYNNNNNYHGNNNNNNNNRGGYYNNNNNNNYRGGYNNNNNNNGGDYNNRYSSTGYDYYNNNNNNNRYNNTGYNNNNNYRFSSNSYPTDQRNYNNNNNNNNSSRPRFRNDY